LSTVKAFYIFDVQSLLLSCVVGRGVTCSSFCSEIGGKVLLKKLVFQEQGKMDFR